MTGAGTGRRPVGGALLLALSVLLAGAGAVAGLWPRASLATVAVLAGLVATVTGGVVLAGSRTVGQETRLIARLLGSAMVVWGVGQLVVGWNVRGGGAGFPTQGDWISALSAPAAVLGVVVLLRRRSLRRHGVRTVLDALLVGGSVGLLLWQLSFRELMLSATGEVRGGSLAILVIIAEASLVAMLLLGWLRGLDRGMGLMALGVGVYAVAHQAILHEILEGERLPPAALGLCCLAWPLIGEGIRRLAPVGAEDVGGAEVRLTVLTIVLSLGVLTAAILTFAFNAAVDWTSTALGLFVVAVFAAREIYSGLQRRHLLETLTEYAFRDPLTGLGNRRAMSVRVAALVGDTMASVLTLDLDGFKEVNDLLGHSRGDELLVSVARQLRLVLPGGCEAYRVGGDEFLIVVPGPPEHGERVAEALLQSVRRAADFLLLTSAVAISASVGLAWWDRELVRAAGHELPSPLPVADLGVLTERAGLLGPEATREVLLASGVALHAAKRSGRDRVESYDGPVAARHRRLLSVERRLRESLGGERLQVHYQPIMNLDSGQVVGVEALARWDDPTLGRVGPEEFIAVAEHAALIGELGRQVLNRSLGDLEALTESFPGLGVAINVSPAQLRSSTFSDDVVRAVRMRGIAPERVTIEVTESVFVDDDDIGVRHLHQLRRDGLNVAIDDFGSGYSALTYLSRLPASILKVDQTLVTNVDGDRRALSVLRAVVALGQSLPMQVAVEGIETQQVHDIVRALGHCYGQGWLYSAAVPVEQLPAVILRLNARWGKQSTVRPVPVQPLWGEPGSGVVVPGETSREPGRRRG